MDNTKILYLGPIGGTCLHRANALRRMGFSVEHIDLRTLLPATAWVDRITWRLGGQWFSPILKKKLALLLAGKQFALCYVDGGEWVTSTVIDLIRQHAPKVINYNIDDPLGPRDGARFLAYRQSISSYDLVAVVRKDNVNEALTLGAREVLRVYRSADEVAHAPRPISPQDRLKWHSDVLFLGTWFTGRGAFMLELIRHGVPLTIRGSSWQKSPEWPQLKAYWKGDELRGDDYAKALQCAKVCLGLLSKENRDLHTTRSAEIPALGGLFCAERTAEHSGMYADRKEALLWSDAGECAEICKEVLQNDSLRNQIAMAGHQRVKFNGHYNEMVLRSILSAAGIRS